MISYTTVGSNDLDRAKAFYDAVLKPLAPRQFSPNDRMHFYAGEAGAMLCVCRPFDQQAASTGNGTMVGLAAPSREAVDQTHALALANGGADEGAPGLRAPGAYVGYFRDPDGNKVAVIHRA